MEQEGNGLSLSCECCAREDEVVVELQVNLADVAVFVTVGSPANATVRTPEGGTQVHQTCPKLSLGTFNVCIGSSHTPNTQLVALKYSSAKIDSYLELKLDTRRK